MRFLISYFKEKQRFFLFFLICAVIYLFSFYLMNLPGLAVLYPTLLCILALLLFLVYDYRREKKRHRRLSEIKGLSAELISSLPEADGLVEQDYIEIIGLLCEQHRELMLKNSFEYQTMADYFTVWVHQIKTPIAVMKLNLQSDDSAESRKLKSELVRIEQYVSMVLAYVRLDSDSTDYLFREYDIDGIIRPCVKKFAGEFIQRRLSLHYNAIGESVITDEKWLSFVLEQILSNALKYTNEGGISIYMLPNKLLCIEDTGIGIAPEDLPRVFENGYTGFNGRTDKSASGIGLYLCRRICTCLGHGISIESECGRGTRVYIDLHSYELGAE